MAVGIVLAIGGFAAVAPPSRADVPLAGGRVLEKVTPADKNGADVLSNVTVSNGRTYLWTSLSFLPEDVWVTQFASYVAERTDLGWALRPGWVAPYTAISDFSRDQGTEVWQQSFGGHPRLTPDDGDDSGDIYLRSSRGLALVSQGAIGGNGGDSVTYAGMSGDASHVLFETAEKLEVADAPRTGGVQLYERTDQGSRVVGLDSAGNLTSVDGAVLGNGAANADASGWTNAISEDGSRVFFQSPPPNSGGTPSQLYARVDGQMTIHVSESQCDRTAPAPACVDETPVTFEGASDDGERVLFSTTGQLTNDDVDQARDLYEYRLSTSTLSRLSVFADPNTCAEADGSPTPCRVTGIAGMSTDASVVYYTALGEAAPGGDAETSGLFVYDAISGETRFLAPAGVVSFRSSGLRRAPADIQVTPGGNVAVFQSNARLSDSDNAGTMQVYRYDHQAGNVACISCRPSGAPSVGDSDIAGARDSTNSAFGTPASPAGGSKPNNIVSSNGDTIAFQTTDALVPQDSNARADVYLWNAGTLSLITLGTGSHDSRFAGMSRDGADVFIITYDQLVPSDTDFHSDLYDARVGGRTESALPVAPECDGDECQGPIAPSPALAAPLSASGSARSDRGRPRLGKITAKLLRSAGRKGALVLPLVAEMDERVTAVARARLGARDVVVAKTRRVVAGRSGPQVVMSLSAAARRQLRTVGHLVLRLTVEFPDASSRSRRVVRLRSSRASNGPRGPLMGKGTITAVPGVGSSSKEGS